MNRIIQPILHSILETSHHDEVYLDGKSRELMLEIQKLLQVFEPVGDDEARHIWLEIPRGTAEEWKSYDDERYEDVEDDLHEYQEILSEEYPFEKEWFFLMTSTYRENTFLKISDRDYRYALFTDRQFECEKRTTHDMAWILEPLLELVKERFTQILKDPEAYNKYIDENLPYRQRFGRIRSKDLNRIIPERALQVDDKEGAIKMLKDLIRREDIYKSAKDMMEQDWISAGVPVPFEVMTIRKFCYYYRVADEAFVSGYNHDNKKTDCGIVDDVKYYTRHGLHGSLSEYNLDSVEDFDKFAGDHYGELGLSRMNVNAIDYYADRKWIITFGYSYSAHCSLALRVAKALYETGAPFIFHEADNLFHILEETSWVRLTPFVFHDYSQGADDDGVFDLPHVEFLGQDGNITREQYDEIVKLAEWKKEEELVVDHTVPFGDPLYDLIREEVLSPLSVSEIRHTIEKKYKTYLTVLKDEDTGCYYFMRPIWNNGLEFKRTEKEYYPTFNKAMRSMILRVNYVINQRGNNDENTIHE